MNSILPPLLNSRQLGYIQRTSPKVEEMIKKLELTIEARDDVDQARIIVRDNLDDGGIPSSAPVITGRALTELTELSGESKIPDFMKFCFLQHIAEEKAFANLLQNQCEDMRSRLSKLHVMIREMEDMDDHLAVFDSLDSLRDTVRSENDKLASLTQLLEQV
uniref:Uncharacterized protein n=1 Tax=Tanacetum cinerariifolium TaxID=118510 RepID=A0A6L2KZN6_TANCI|nr:hypothetical protein [Tanacetum cinerariifolium]